MPSRDINDCHPDLQKIVPVFLHACHVENIDILITCTYRSSDEQNKLYAQGRTAPGKIVTNAIGGQSKHNFTINGKPASKAFDFVPMLNGKPAWNSLDLFKRAGEIGESLGLEWAGRWKGFKELAHLQLKERN